ncbi:hypothetical protein B0H14DRAFT_2876413, partial [Mycena olivaceomarginata]
FKRAARKPQARLKPTVFAASCLLHFLLPFSLFCYLQFPPVSPHPQAISDPTQNGGAAYRSRFGRGHLRRKSLGLPGCILPGNRLSLFGPCRLPVFHSL